MDKTLKQIKDLRSEVKDLLDAVKAEDRAPSAEEVKKLTSLNDQIKALEEKANFDVISKNNSDALSHLMAPVVKNSSSFQEEIKGFLNEAKENSNRAGRVDLRATISTKNLTSEFAANTGGFNARIATPAGPAFSEVQIIPELLSFFNVVPTNAGVVRVASLSSYTNNAAAHAQAAAASGVSNKAESDLNWTGRDQVLATVAHFVKASRDILSDSARLESFIGAKLLQGAMRRACGLLFTGNASTPGQFDGFDNYAVQTEATTGVTGLNRIALAIGKLANAGDGNTYQPNAIFMNPADWATIATSQSSSAYLLGMPGSNLMNSIWGVPVVRHGAVPAGFAYVGDFSQVDVYWNDNMNVYVSDSDGDDFKKNILTILGEVRMTLGMSYPQAVCRVTL